MLCSNFRAKITQNNHPLHFEYVFTRCHICFQGGNHGRRRTASEVRGMSEEDKKLEAAHKKKRAELAPYIQIAKWPKSWFSLIEDKMRAGVCQPASFKELRGWPEKTQLERLQKFAIVAT